VQPVADVSRKRNVADGKTTGVNGKPRNLRNGLDAEIQFSPDTAVGDLEKKIQKFLKYLLTTIRYFVIFRA